TCFFVHQKIRMMARLLVFLSLLCLGTQAFSQKLLVVLHRRPASQYVDTMLAGKGDQIDVRVKGLRVVGTIAYVTDSVINVGDTIVPIAGIQKIGMPRTRQQRRAHRVGGGILMFAGLAGVGVGLSQSTPSIPALGVGGLFLATGTTITIRGGL